MAVQQTRAAVVGVQGETTQQVQLDLAVHSALPTTVDVAAILLPPGTTAGGYGRTALVPNTPEWRASGLGMPQRVHLRVPQWCAELLHWAGRERLDGGEAVPGPLDLPVWADMATGVVQQVDTDRLVAELGWLKGEGRALWRANTAPLAGVRTAVRAPGVLGRLAGSVVREWREAIGDVVGDLRGTTPPRPLGHPRPEDAGHGPVEGVAYRTWVTVLAGLEKDRVHPLHLDAYAVHRGVPPGRWPAVDAAWAQRATADPVLAAWRAYDVHRLTPTGATWEIGA